ncbi:guanylate cyclase soluble subunit beta-2-like [Lineus longissimus]|uniref:guanylate cyclase soluble subunit beta-2-like n=1 Tax=Lineus longissimus TaxID=88925 RepID=UPI00315CE2C0
MDKDTAILCLYGQIHLCVQSLIEQKFGEEAWLRVLAKSEMDDTHDFMTFHRYDDALSVKLIVSASEELGIPLTTVLEVFGEFFLEYCLSIGYDKMLLTLGGDFVTFMQNLDSFHALLSMTYTDLDAPSFRVDTNDDGSFDLHYYSPRHGLYPIVSGLLGAVGRRLFDTVVTATIGLVELERTSDTLEQQHVVFHITLELPDTLKAKLDNVVEYYPEEFFMNPANFSKAFPYHIIFDSNLEIKQMGSTLQKLCPKLLTKGLTLDKSLEMVHPHMNVTFPNLRSFINANYIMQTKPGFYHNENINLVLKGQMLWMDDIQHMIYVCSPRLASLTEMEEKGVFLSDIPIYDVTRELILLNQQRIAEIEISKKLDEVTANLKVTHKMLAVEKKKTDTLLYQMLPRKVADALRDGHKVPAEKFKIVTILFSDIVTFTNIAAASTPMGIVSMLNALYSQFDHFTEVHDVYKVETIGDAYMVVSGVPVPDDLHAVKVANFALDMIEAAKTIPSPATGLPLQIRVGLHSGPVVAGVVGEKMPRYCLFGDTVNTSSRMESHGTPGRIHISPFTYDVIKGGGYMFRDRGEVDVKGKGLMHTYFMLGNKEKTIPEPKDDCMELPVMDEIGGRPMPDSYVHAECTPKGVGALRAKGLKVDDDGNPIAPEEDENNNAETNKTTGKMKGSECCRVI